MSRRRCCAATSSATPGTQQEQQHAAPEAPHVSVLLNEVLHYLGGRQVKVRGSPSPTPGAVGQR